MRLLTLTLAVLAPQAATAQDATPDARAPAPSSPLHADEPGEPPYPPTKDGIGYRDATVLGVVEGITEYLPISSTGHLILANILLGLDENATPLRDRAGEPIYLDAGSEDAPAPTPFTLKDAADAYAIVIQGGAILAVVLLYWRRLLGILRGLLGRDPHGLRLGMNLLVAFLPAAFLGLLLDDLIESYLFSAWAVITALIAGAGLMLWVERWRRRRASTPVDHAVPADSGPDLHELPFSGALLIGFMQCVAMWPGTSRSMMTIVGGYLAGLSPKRAAEFSFLLGLITLTAASGYKALQRGPEMLRALEIGPVLFGMAVATVSAALAVRWLVNYLTRHGLALFAWYRIGLALVMAAFLYTTQGWEAFL